MNRPQIAVLVMEEPSDAAGPLMLSDFLAEPILTRMGRFRTPGPGLRDAEYTGAQIRHAADEAEFHHVFPAHPRSGHALPLTEGLPDDPARIRLVPE